MRTTLFAAFVAIALAGATAWAQPTPPAQDPRAAHAETDKNRDGGIDHEEFHARMVEVFYHADVDKKGGLSEAEFATLDSKDSFVEMDTNKDGSVSMAEFVDRRTEQFNDVDTNDDGVLSVQEVVDYVGP